MDKKVSVTLEKCKSFCNEEQVFPAMKELVEKKNMSRRQAGREVEKLTGGAVTASRADKVYRDRTTATNVAVKKKRDKDKDPDMVKAENLFNQIARDSKNIRVILGHLHRVMKKLNATEIDGLKALTVEVEMFKLVHNLKGVLDILGYDIKKISDKD